MAFGQMPGFALGRQGAESEQIPVFVFHDVAPERLERQLQFLRSNDYRTLDADELAATVRRRRGAERAVALTFDDATWTFWTYAFPLLRHYGFRAILFAIPGLVPDDPEQYPNLGDVAAGRCSLSDLYQRARSQPLCTWNELAILHASGVVDIQSHSMTHARIPISPRLVDFLRPDFDRDRFGTNVPLSVLDDPRRPERRLRLGAPVLESASRLAGRPRFKEDPELVATLADYVESHGGVEFFRTSGWRKRLVRVYEKWPERRRGSFETAAEMEQWVQFELSKSKQELETRLAGKQVRHFCYPWFQGSSLADRRAAEVGYQAVYRGIFSQDCGRLAAPLRVSRISGEYLLTLPGAGRASSWSIWGNRLRHYVCGPRVLAT